MLYSFNLIKSLKINPLVFDEKIGRDYAVEIRNQVKFAADQDFPDFI